MKVSCNWMPEWIGYLAEVEEEGKQLSRLLRSREQLPQFVRECQEIFNKERKQQDENSLH